MTATYHFHIQNFVHVSNSQIQQHSQGAVQNTHSKPLDLNHEMLKEILLQLHHIKQSIVFDEEHRQTLLTDIHAISAQLQLKKPRQSIILACLHSLKTSLESAVNNTLIADILAKISALLGGG